MGSGAPSNRQQQIVCLNYCSSATNNNVFYVNGMLIGMLESVCNCVVRFVLDCPAGQVFSSCAGSCPYSCEDLCPGCSCPPGAVKHCSNPIATT
uniref:VWFC domain-containing protein n=1 Tax=Sinocyclocheilus anshuiensis TaxID=1608454 RepID=A0A671P7Q2_9TELE